MIQEPADEREADVEKRCDALAVAFGYRVCKYSLRKRSGIHPNTPDRRYQGKAALWFEVKRIGGKPSESRLSEGQHAFLEAELDAGALASCGTAVELYEVLSVLARGSEADARAVCRKQIARWAAKGFRREAA